MSTLGRKTPSIGGSRASIYSHASTVRTVRGNGGSKSGRGGPAAKLPWWRKPIVSHAIYTDLQRGSWHIGFYTLFLGVFTMFTSGFDLYCLHEATPGYSHTGYYIISFDFVYVGNPHVRNLLIMSGAFSLLGGLALVVACVMLLDGLRKEQENAFIVWLWVMVFFTPWKIVAWVYAAVVNDMIFVYNILTFLAWAGFNLLNVFSFICIWSLYLELNDLTKIQDLARLKLETRSVRSSRPPSVFSDDYATYHHHSYQPDDYASLRPPRQEEQPPKSNDYASLRPPRDNQQQLSARQLQYAVQEEQEQRRLEQQLERQHHLQEQQSHRQQKQRQQEGSQQKQRHKKQHVPRPQSLQEQQQVQQQLQQQKQQQQHKQQSLQQQVLLQQQRPKSLTPLQQQISTESVPMTEHQTRQHPPLQRLHRPQSLSRLQPQQQPKAQSIPMPDPPPQQLQQLSPQSLQQQQQLLLQHQQHRTQSLAHPQQQQFSPPVLQQQQQRSQSLAHPPQRQPQQSTPTTALPSGRGFYKMDTMNSLPASRAASAYGSRPTSPYVNRDTLRSNLNAYNAQLQQQDQHQPYKQQQQHSDYGYGQVV